MLRRLLGRKSKHNPARDLYRAIVAQARRPEFYADRGVADTVSGRFEMITLHGVLVLDRLQAGGDAEADLSRALVEELFSDMDRSLREMGVGDLSVGKKVRTMAEVFYGRAKAYGEALSLPDGQRRPALAAALARNVYGGAPPAGCAEAMADYALALRQRLDGLRTVELAARLGGAEKDSISP